MWRESLGCYKILTEDKKGYRSHPAVKEFENNVYLLWERLLLVRNEMMNRGYNPKPIPRFLFKNYNSFEDTGYYPWQTLEEQIEILKNKHCKCNI